MYNLCNVWALIELRNSHHFWLDATLSSRVSTIRKIKKKKYAKKVNRTRFSTRGMAVKL